MIKDPDFRVIPDETAFRICQQEHREVYDKFAKRIQELMNWRPSRATYWMAEPNPMLGGVSPVSMIAHGRAKRLDKFITEAESDNGS